jgi:peptidoglycan/LPS O-acetylase OafA/YrhL
MSTSERLHALDAVRALALLLGVVFHAGFSFIPGMPPGLWAIVDTSPSTNVSTLLFTSHIFRMTLFFLIAGFFARLAFHRKGARAFWTDRGKRILVPLIVGWIALAPTMGVIWIWGLTKTFGGTLPAPPADMPPPPAAAFRFMHLWFLYYLFLLYVLVIAVRGLVVRSSWRSFGIRCGSCGSASRRRINRSSRRPRRSSATSPRSRSDGFFTGRFTCCPPGRSAGRCT